MGASIPGSLLLLASCVQDCRGTVLRRFQEFVAGLGRLTTNDRQFPGRNRGESSHTRCGKAVGVVDCRDTTAAGRKLWLRSSTGFVNFATRLGADEFNWRIEV